MSEQNFVCEQCGREIKGESLGTAHRNHCPFCLWSKHLDGQTPGDRAASCGGMMKPVGLTFKQEQDKTGELMIVHRCMVCGEVKKNRIAGDDDVNTIECLYRECMKLSAEEIVELKDRGIRILDKTDEMEVLSQLYGKSEAERRMQSVVWAPCQNRTDVRGLRYRCFATKLRRQQDKRLNIWIFYLVGKKKGLARNGEIHVDLD